MKCDRPPVDETTEGFPAPTKAQIKSEERKPKKKEATIFNQVTWLFVPTSAGQLQGQLAIWRASGARFLRPAWVHLGVKFSTTDRDRRSSWLWVGNWWLWCPPTSTASPASSVNTRNSRRVLLWVLQSPAMGPVNLGLSAHGPRPSRKRCYHPRKCVSQDAPALVHLGCCLLFFASVGNPTAIQRASPPVVRIKVPQ